MNGKKNADKQDGREGNKKRGRKQTSTDKEFKRDVGNSKNVTV